MKINEGWLRNIYARTNLSKNKCVWIRHDTRYTRGMNEMKEIPRLGGLALSFSIRIA